MLGVSRKPGGRPKQDVQDIARPMPVKPSNNETSGKRSCHAYNYNVVDVED